MGIINICFQLVSCSDTSHLSQALMSKNNDAFADLEHQYQSFYKQIAAFLYSHPDLMFSFSFSSRLIEWFAKYHKEYVLLISEMSSRRQIEFLGGALHNPLLPSLLPIDRVGQIEQFTMVLRQHTGKRPRGMILPNNAWDASLVSSLRTCGMEFVIMDARLFPDNKNAFLPCIVQEQGKNIYVLGQDISLVPGVGCSPKQYLDKIKDKVVALCPEADNPLVCCSLSPEQTCQLISSGWFSSFVADIKSHGSRYGFATNTPSKYLKGTQHFQRVYIPAGILDSKTGRPNNIYDYLLEDTATYLLYSKMMYVSMLVNQSRGDKIRKKATKDFVWQSQNGAAYDGEKTPAGDERRKNAYRNLIQAERTVREYMDFFDSVTTFDYDGDGVREYVCQFDCYNAYVQARGGSVFELDVMKAVHNYVGKNPSGHAGLFLDFFSKNHNAATALENFSRQIYKEVYFDGKRHEIKLLAAGTVGESFQPVSLKKNYSLNSSGIQVQYIIKNESSSSLRQIFSVQSNFFLPSTENESLKLELISGEQKTLSVLTNPFSKKCNKEVSLVRFTDGDVTFVFEMNENADICFFEKKGRLEVLVSWPMEIPAEREIEKTISFSVVSKGTRRKKK